MPRLISFLLLAALLMPQASHAEKPSFVSEVVIQTEDTTLAVRWQPPRRGPEPDRYVVVLRDDQGKRVKGGRVVVEATAPLQASFEGLASKATYKVSVRGVAGKAKGRLVQYIVALGADVEPLSSKNYMYYCQAGEPTPDDAIGEPTRHVKLINGIWQRYDPRREYVANALWWYYAEVSKAEEELPRAEEALAIWREANPDVPIEHPILAHRVDLARQAVVNTKRTLQIEEKKAFEEAAKRFPAEDLGINDGRWVERPKPRSK